MIKMTGAMTPPSPPLWRNFSAPYFKVTSLVGAKQDCSCRDVLSCTTPWSVPLPIWLCLTSSLWRYGEGVYRRMKESNWQPFQVFRAGISTPSHQGIPFRTSHMELTLLPPLKHAYCCADSESDYMFCGGRNRTWPFLQQTWIFFPPID